jgi:hypothetical protein
MTDDAHHAKRASTVFVAIIAALFLALTFPEAADIVEAALIGVLVLGFIYFIAWEITA